MTFIGNVVSTTPSAVAATANSSSSTSSTQTSGNQISSNDFLTLLVAEMKNQDPTQPTDPTQYIQQLVEVNSLEQLIGINQDVSDINSAVTGATSA